MQAFRDLIPIGFFRNAKIPEVDYHTSCCRSILSKLWSTRITISRETWTLNLTLSERDSQIIVRLRSRISDDIFIKICKLDSWSLTCHRLIDSSLSRSTDQVSSFWVRRHYNDHNDLCDLFEISRKNRSTVMESSCIKSLISLNESNLHSYVSKLIKKSSSFHQSTGTWYQE